MEKGLFRQKSLDKVSSPEQMNDYIRVTSPGVWPVTAAAAGRWVYPAALDEGVYEAQIAVDSVSPISFLGAGSIASAKRGTLL